MAETFRITKLEKFIQKQVDHINSQEKMIEILRRKGVEESNEILDSLLMNQLAHYEYTVELCGEFGIEMPEVLADMSVEILEDQEI